MMFICICIFSLKNVFLQPALTVTACAYEIVFSLLFVGLT